MEFIHSFGNFVKVNAVVRRGDVDRALAESAHVAHAVYTSPVGEHAFLEPETALAYLDEDGVLVVPAHMGQLEALRVESRD